MCHFSVALPAEPVLCCQLINIAWIIYLFIYLFVESFQHAEICCSDSCCIFLLLLFGGLVFRLQLWPVDWKMLIDHAFSSISHFRMGVRHRHSWTYQADSAHIDKAPVLTECFLEHKNTFSFCTSYSISWTFKVQISAKTVSVKFLMQTLLTFSKTSLQPESKSFPLYFALFWLRLTPLAVCVENVCVEFLSKETICCFLSKQMPIL